MNAGKIVQLRPRAAGSRRPEFSLENGTSRIVQASPEIDQRSLVVRQFIRTFDDLTREWADWRRGPGSRGLLVGFQASPSRKSGNKIVQRVAGDTTQGGQYPKRRLALGALVQPVSFLRPVPTDAEHPGELFLREFSLAGFTAEPDARQAQCRGEKLPRFKGCVMVIVHGHSLPNK
jgi:hypothetical protein